MERTIDISTKDGRLWAEDEGYLSDFTKEEGYLFSILVGIKNASIFHKDYPHAKNTFKGKYFITLGDYDGELFCTNDYNMHIEHNIVENGFWGNYMSPAYQETLVLDMDKVSISLRDESLDIVSIIKENAKQDKWSEV